MPVVGFSRLTHLAPSAGLGARGSFLGDLYGSPAIRQAGYGFNELANEWHSDHIFKHDPGAIKCFLLVAFLAYNIFHVFLARNVKPVRKGKTQIFWARLIAAELYSEVAPAGMSP